MAVNAQTKRVFTQSEFAKTLLDRRARTLLSISEVEREVVREMIKTRRWIQDELKALEGLPKSVQQLRLNRLLAEANERILEFGEDFATGLVSGVETAFSKGALDIASALNSGGFGSTASFSQVPTKALEAAIKRPAIQLSRKGLVQDMSARITETLRTGIARGESVPKMSRQLKQQLNISQGRAQTIIRTNLNAAGNEGHLEVLEENPEIVAAKKWDATLDNRTTVICSNLHGQIRKVDENFSLGGSEWASPPAHYNCRSQVMPVFNDPFLNDLVEKDSKSVREFYEDSKGRVKEAAEKSIVNSDISANTYLRSQPRGVQAQVLKSEYKAQMFAAGKINVSDVITDDLTVKTDVQIRELVARRA